MILEDSRIKLCQQEIIRLDLQINAIIQDIRECGGLVDLQDLNQDVRDRVAELKSRIKELDTLANEQDRETDRVALLQDVDNHNKQLACAQTNLRKANLASQLAIEKREKDSLLGENDTSGTVRHRTHKEGMAKTASNITDSLTSLSRNMAAQVQAQEATLGTLARSSGQVVETHEEFKAMSGHIATSRKILTRYGRREVTDKLLIFLALVFFFATVLYIVKKRFFGSASVLEAAGLNNANDSVV